MKRWKTIRDRYVRELKRVKKRKSGDDAKSGDDVHSHLVPLQCSVLFDGVCATQTVSWKCQLNCFMNLYVFLCRTHTNLEVVAEVLPADKGDSFADDNVVDLEDKYVQFSYYNNNCRIFIMLCLYHSDVDNLTSSPAASSMLSSRQSSREPSQEQPQKLPPKKKRRCNKGNEEIDSLLVRNLKALEEPSQADEELFGRQVGMSL